jgi:Tfp pilus assembly protein PilE
MLEVENPSFYLERKYDNNNNTTTTTINNNNNNKKKKKKKKKIHVIGVQRPSTRSKKTGKSFYSFNLGIC